MSTLRALLDIHGSIDTAVISSPDPRVAEIADRFYPGASTNTEWYREIEAFAFPFDRSDSNEEARSEANPIRGLREINDDRNEDDEPPPTIPELSRLMYGLGAVLHLNSVVRIWPELPSADSHGEDATRALLTDVIALAGPTDSFERNHRILDERLDDVLDVFANQFMSWQDWFSVANVLQSMGVLSAEIASVPLCQASVVTIDGIESVVVDTDFAADDVSLERLKGVVDPRNWHNNYPHFFCRMQDKGPRTDGWHKVLETVGVCAYPPSISPRLVTMLKFYKTTEPYSARLDYDLNDPTPGEGDGQITVDRGFINMWSPNNAPTLPGVRVRTRKVAHINGVRPYTQKRYVCIFGYAYGTIEMLFGSARNPDPNFTYTPWEEPTGGTQQGKGGDGGTAKPKPSDNSVASTWFKMWADCVTDLTKKNMDLSDKWMDGKLTFDDLATYSAEVGARVASDPWKFLKAISQPKGGGT